MLDIERSHPEFFSSPVPHIEFIPDDIVILLLHSIPSIPDLNSNTCSIPREYRPLPIHRFETAPMDCHSK